MGEQGLGDVFNSLDIYPCLDNGLLFWLLVRYSTSFKEWLSIPIIDDNQCDISLDVGRTQ